VIRLLEKVRFIHGLLTTSNRYVIKLITRHSNILFKTFYNDKLKTNQIISFWSIFCFSSHPQGLLDDVVEELGLLRLQDRNSEESQKFSSEGKTHNQELQTVHGGTFEQGRSVFHKRQVRVCS